MLYALRPLSLPPPSPPHLDAISCVWTDYQLSGMISCATIQRGGSDDLRLLQRLCRWWRWISIPLQFLFLLHSGGGVRFSLPGIITCDHRQTIFEHFKEKATQSNRHKGIECLSHFAHPSTYNAFVMLVKSIKPCSLHHKKARILIT